MKRLIIIVIALLFIGAAGYFIAPQLPVMRQYQLNYFMEKCGEELDATARRSKLYRASNLADLNGRKLIAFNFQLQTAALFNPEDTREFCAGIMSKYRSFTDTLQPFVYGNLMAAPITFHINEYEDFGPVYELKQGIVLDHYDSVVTAILASDTKLATRDKEEMERRRKLDWMKKQAPIAWQAIRFGDSEKVFESKAIADPSIEKNRWSGDNAVYEITINGRKYRLAPQFFDKQLYLLNIGSAGYNEADYNTLLKSDWESLVSYFTKQYGRAKGTFISSGQLKEGEISWTQQWEILSKIVNIGLSRHQGNYYVILWIGDQNRMQLAN